MTEIDETDVEIVKKLEKNARGSFREIAEELNVSEGTVYNRVKKMQEEGIIKGFSARTDSMKLGKRLVAIIGLRVNGGHLVEVEEELAEEEEIRCAYDVTGEYDAMVIGRFETRAELNEFVKTTLSNKYVERTTTHIVLNVVKEDFRTF
ncbi:AsnC family transcriptional regulator [candidate division MSBL1 archaeon SCGC-AAA259M10]|uniref:AsnC family transcriptional regulator n=4 Tax=candidate division MSBL1 TaxID=215777 RepID=A0A133V5P5_9EURY|nr:AsnC family transcriptional regulator [candidate division MSBL1 archaeon SCGC-AAA259E17]KXA95778.1 AsnC family transcriptional regulator [candidate division MSBL1 archaeon SCGC-AAA259E19]KXA98927.1 AsnC family transcriptional regulator [candidate division MSBL1 archaeon SCGC-AAA259M10]KXB01763.1 AsnC family transcriptional regulator [candidate division MSBL1 archaeon SCGC-AAA259O05]